MEEKFEEKIQVLKEVIDRSKNIVVFTGAGISVPSGIQDFRSANGLYNQKLRMKVRPEEIISRHFFDARPKDFFKFYKKKMLNLTAKPNVAHEYFAKLEREGKVIGIVTQNIDGLHQLSGSEIVFELHGSVHRNFCMNCGKFFDADYVKNSKDVPLCDTCLGIVKPDVVLYEEPLNSQTIENSVNLISQADTLIVVGTSLIVQPAASLIRYFKGNDVIILNKSETPMDDFASLSINEDIVKIINALIDANAVQQRSAFEQ